LAENYLLFFGNPGSKVAWSRGGSNPGPSDSQFDPMTTQPGLFGKIKFEIKGSRFFQTLFV